jgi:hypothetical protein
MYRALFALILVVVPGTVAAQQGNTLQALIDGDEGLISGSLLFDNFTATLTGHGNVSPGQLRDITIRTISPEEFFRPVGPTDSPPPGTTFQGGLTVFTPPIFPFGSGLVALSPDAQITLNLGYDITNLHPGSGFDYISLTTTGSGQQNIFPQLPNVAGGGAIETLTSPALPGSVLISQHGPRTFIFETSATGLPVRLQSTHVDTTITAFAQTFVEPTGNTSETLGAVHTVTQGFGLLVPEPSTWLLLTTGLIGLALVRGEGEEILKGHLIGKANLRSGEAAMGKS